jgi:NAD(P)-dependent dehydrogenase (short-subunit alcohol dehydrogenase family)
MNKKVVLVTGASSGLGKSIAQYLSAKGFKVYGTSRSFGKDIEGVTMLKMNVTKKEEIKAALSIIIQIEQRIDVLINNAGIGMAAPLEDSETADFKNVIDTNLVGAYEVIKSVLPQMRKQGEGLIINVSSIAAKFGLPYRSAYCASKARWMD